MPIRKASAPTPASSSLSKEESAKLGFKPPTPPVEFSDVPETTKIRGFFNPNQWPVRISNSALNLQVTLNHKNEYICVPGPDGKPLKATDPRLMKHVGPQQLAVEYGDTDLPCVLIPVADVSHAQGFSGVSVIPKAHRVVIHEPVAKKEATDIPRPATPAAPGQRLQDGILVAGSVTGMSMELARKHGLVGNARPIQDDGKIDDGKLHDSAASLPVLRTPPYDRVKVPASFTEMARQTETAQQAATVQALEEAAADTTADAEDVATAVIKKAAKGMPRVTITSRAPAQAPVALADDVGGDLPEPDLDDPATQAAPKAEAPKKAKRTPPGKVTKGAVISNGA